MTDERYLRFIDGSMTEEEEAAFLRDRPDIWREVQVSMYADGELPEDDRKEVEAELATSARLQQVFGDTLLWSAVAHPEEQPQSAAQASEQVPPVTTSFWRWRWPVFGGLATAAAAAVALVMLRSMPAEISGPERLTIRIDHAGGLNYRAGRAARLQDVMVAEVPLRDGQVTGLRIYQRDDAAIRVMCPGDVRCERTPSSLGVRFKFEQPGVYDVLWLYAAGALPAATGSAEGDIEALPPDADFELQTISVRPE